jgi:hypothetical protein
MSGYLIEKAFKVILNHLDCWTLLLAFLFVGYWVNGMLLYRLNSNAISLNDEQIDRSSPEAAKVMQNKMIELWDQRNNMPNYTNAEISKFNTDFNTAFHAMPFCDNHSKQLPTKFPLDLNTYDPKAIFTCYKKVINSNWQITEKTYKTLLGLPNSFF